MAWKPMPCHQILHRYSVFNISFLLQVELLRTKRGTRFYRGEPDRQPARRTLLIIHVQKSSPSFDTSCETPSHVFFLKITTTNLIIFFFFVCMCFSLFCTFVFVNYLYMFSVSSGLTACVLIVCIFVYVFSAHCVDSDTSAVHSSGETWLRWKGQRVEYCRCTLRGRELCHTVPVIGEFDIDAWTRGHLVLLSCPFIFLSLVTSLSGIMTSFYL